MRLEFGGVTATLWLQREWLTQLLRTTTGQEKLLVIKFLPPSLPTLVLGYPFICSPLNSSATLYHRVSTLRNFKVTTRELTLGFVSGGSGRRAGALLFAVERDDKDERRGLNFDCIMFSIAS
ncbi:hypothetical protein QAD02_024036 [Eretmocerus hayati]|uniref:Uncharacterized protein n=1 Tax=Eretmocerus hayati TaxID=131215 RepID=A0ACC2PZR8_9HYME|nr:hypothetical protein QAD02_024036 [Eretmocerus hayati]